MSRDGTSEYDAYISAVAADKDRARFGSAEAMTFGQRFLAGPDLFDLGNTMMRAGIRMDYPAANPLEVERILIERLQSSQRIENRL